MARRRLKGEGSLYQRSSDGRWIGAVSLGYDDRGKPLRKTVSAKTATEARIKLAAVERQISSGQPPSDDQMTVGQLITRWEETVLRHQVSTVCYENYVSIAKKHIIPELGRKKVSKVTAADVDALISAKVDAGYAISTVRRIRNVLSQAMDQAVKWDTTGRNVVTLTRGPKEARREGRTLTVEQARALLESLQGHRLEAFFVTMLGIGLRPGEALALGWQDVHFDKKTVSIRRSLKREKNKLVLGDVKTAKSRRTLNLPQPVVDALDEHRARQSAERRAVGPVWTDTGLVFTTEAGTPIDPSNLRRTFHEVFEKAKLGDWHPHELRHSAASIMLAQQVPLEVVAVILGHSSIRMTADVYGHIMEPQRQAAAEAMTSALWGSSANP